MSDTRDDRQLIADVLEHDRSMTPAPWSKVQISTVDRSIPPSTYLDALGVGAYRTAAPELARRLAALLDTLDEWHAGWMTGRAALDGIRAAYARNLERSKP